MALNQRIHPIFKDIRFWIVFFFLIRLYGITFPPLEVGHNWRQTDGLMIARNFYERSANILYPTVDLAGEKTGIVGCEFPILNYLIYLLSLLFGYEGWFGRLIVLFFSSLGSWYFFRLIKNFFGEEVAFNATIILMVSLWFSYSRKVIPDAFAASLCLIGLYYAFQYLEKGKLFYLFLFFFLALLGCLSKILVATILTPLLLPILNKNILLQRKIVLSFCSAIILFAVSWWYFIWVPHLNTTFGFEEHFYMGISFKDGLTQILDNGPAMLKRFYSTPLKYIGFVVFLVSIFLTIRKRQWLSFIIFFLPFFSFLILLIKTGTSILGDQYYFITAIPSMAFLIGWTLADLTPKKIGAIVLLIIGVESIADQIYDFRIRQPFKSLENLESVMDKYTRRDDLIAINGGAHNPTAMYFAHRRGWVAANSTLSDTTFINEIKRKGCKYVVSAKHLNGDFNIDYPIIHDSEYFKIYQLNNK